MGIAFVAFTTQFGGGFASSAQLYQYFINYGLRMRSAVWPAAMPTISKANGTFGSALWMEVLYFFFQLASVSVMYQHMEPVTDVKQINRAAIGMFVCNFAAMELSIIGLLAIAYAADLATLPFRCSF